MNAIHHLVTRSLGSFGRFRGSPGKEPSLDRILVANPSDPHENAIEVRNITKIFGSGDHSVIAVDDISVAIQNNEFFTLLGPSGCGKTTLLRLIAGFERPTSGTILLQGEDISLLPPYLRRVNTVFQHYALFPHMTVAGNIGFGLEMLGKPKSEVKATVDKILRLVRMETLRDRHISQLSGGQQQRVALARALAPCPQVLLLDEPLSALDLKLRKAMQSELRQLQLETGVTFIYVTHDQGEALALSDRIAVMNAGKILQIGTPREVYEQPTERFVAQFIGASNFLKAELVNVHHGHAELRLLSGSMISAPLPKQADATSGQRFTLAIRPEHAGLTRTLSDALLTGKVVSIDYLGTDSYYHLQLADGEAFSIRMPNLRGQHQRLRVGETVGIQLAENAVQILRD